MIEPSYFRPTCSCGHTGEYPTQGGRVLCPRCAFRVGLTIGKERRKFLIHHPIMALSEKLQAIWDKVFG